jgi:hypothetical protein
MPSRYRVDLYHAIFGAIDVESTFNPMRDIGPRAEFFAERLDDLRPLFLGDIDAIIADTADLIAQHGLDVADVREALLYDMFGGRAKSSASSTPA